MLEGLFINNFSWILLMHGDSVMWAGGSLICKDPPNNYLMIEERVGIIGL